MSETSVAACKNCDQPIRLFYGTWIHDRPDSNEAFSSAPFCDTDSMSKAEPFEGDE